MKQPVLRNKDVGNSLKSAVKGIHSYVKTAYADRLDTDYLLKVATEQAEQAWRNATLLTSNNKILAYAAYHAGLQAIRIDISNTAALSSRPDLILKLRGSMKPGRFAKDPAGKGEERVKAPLTATNSRLIRIYAAQHGLSLSKALNEVVANALTTTLGDSVRSVEPSAPPSVPQPQAHCKTPASPTSET